MAQRGFRRSVVLFAFLEVVEKVDLVVFARAEHRRRNQDGRDVWKTPIERINRNITKMAKNDGIIAITRAMPLRKTSETTRR